ncbi:MAG: peptidoglycan DD-metalloendopeptidase family protein [Steroidobacteraceae bacterium]|nr:peptidoglycan DD-metalloendopeptidase family protein [Deltaproteobacteria bacterium]
MNKQTSARQGNRISRLGRTLLPAVVLCALSVSPAQADFFRYTGEDGVVTFTNTPTNRGAVRVLREAKLKKQGTKGIKGALKSEPQLGTQEPLLPVSGTISSNYGWRNDPIDGGMRHHNGVDIAVQTGTSVKAIAAGRVVQSVARGGYGNLVSIDHGDGMVSIYGHNAQLNVSVGDQVEAGQTVALSGSTGRSTGPHLHFELWKNGTNITGTYLKDGAGLPEVAQGIRSYLHSDGSLVFTNY